MPHYALLVTVATSRTRS